MDYKPIFVAQLVFCLIGHGISKQGESVCRKANAGFCGECIQAGPNCGWCTDRSFRQGREPNSARCDDVAVLLRKGCPESKIENPTASQELLENIMVTDTAGTFKGEHITQIQPQKLRLKLRPGVPMTFSVKYKSVQDHPVDLYYLMSMTSSTKEDFGKAKILASTLLQEMKNLTSDFRIGFGSFVETTVKSSASETPAKTCAGDQNCTSILRFKHMLDFTRNMMLFNKIVNKQHFSENLDAREGGLDAMMQIAACHEQIGWRRHATRLLVFSTDSEFNFTRASKAGETVLPNDGQCHLEKSTAHHHESPSIAQVVQKLKENNIHVIFAVPEELELVYKELENMLSRSGVGTFSANSTGVILQIVDTYTSLSRDVILAHSTLPKGINISYKSYCKNGGQGMEENGRRCSNISIGDEVQFQISVTAHKCLKTEQETIKVKMLGSTEEVEVILRSICECECQHNRIRGGPPCIGADTMLECGVCRCEKGRFGKYCECSSDDMDIDYGGATACVKPGGRSEICSNHGDCMCGHCFCHQRENPNEVYSGIYCECDNFSCDRDDGKICGGHGVCICGVCQCELEYMGGACACPASTTACIASNGHICNGVGVCECGQCTCIVPEFYGPTCELSVLSTGPPRFTAAGPSEQEEFVTESMQKPRDNE